MLPLVLLLDENLLYTFVKLMVRKKKSVPSPIQNLKEGGSGNHEGT